MDNLVNKWNLEVVSRGDEFLEVLSDCVRVVHVEKSTDGKSFCVFANPISKDAQVSAFYISHFTSVEHAFYTAVQHAVGFALNQVMNNKVEKPLTKSEIVEQVFTLEHPLALEVPIMDISVVDLDLADLRGFPKRSIRNTL